MMGGDADARDGFTIALNCDPIWWQFLWRGIVAEPNWLLNHQHWNRVIIIAQLKNYTPRKITLP